MGINKIVLKEKLESEIRGLVVEFDNADGKAKWLVETKLLEKKLELNKLRTSNKIASKAQSAKDLINEIRNKPSVARYETGVSALDNKLLGGIEIGSFVQLAGSSFAGKTHLAIEILSNVAKYKKVLFFNFEMGDRRIAQRFEKSLETEKARENMMIHNSNRELNHIVDEIKQGARDGIKFFAIDSKMKIELSSEKEDYKKFSVISATLSKLTQENEIIIFLINQISEDDDKTGRLAFKGSGDQLYDTDLALFYTMDKKDLSYRKLVCRKNRQDENNFVLNLKLDGRGKTIEADGMQTVYQDNVGRATAKPTVTEYEVPKIEMGMI